VAGQLGELVLVASQVLAPHARVGVARVDEAGGLVDVLRSRVVPADAVDREVGLGGKGETPERPWNQNLSCKRSVGQGDITGRCRISSCGAGRGRGDL
jgi:hypothetical protein